VSELAPRHESADEQHQRGERREQDVVGNVGGGLGAEGRAADGHGAEDDPATEQDVAGAVAVMAPISEVTPTTTREPVVAWAADWSRR
jgi:hypothetical protein